MMKILIDIDGTIYNFVDYFIQHLLSKGVIEHPLIESDITDYNLCEVLNLPKEKVNEEIVAFCLEGWFRGSPAYSSGRWIRRLQDRGHRITFCTEKPIATNETLNHEIGVWLQKHFGRHEMVIVASDIPSIVKRTWSCATHHAVVDDKVENVVAGAAVGCYSILMNRSWNIQYDLSVVNRYLVGTIVRADSWHDAYNLLVAYENENELDASKTFRKFW